jgi:thymidylate synthase (FAD)
LSIETFSEPTVELIQHVGDDVAIARAAWISTTVDEREKDEGRIRGLLNYLMEQRHGTPFEHAWATIRVEAELFTFYEWHRHRIQSFNEESGRYTKATPRFWQPAPERPLVNVGTSARPKMAPASQEQYERGIEVQFEAYTYAWNAYEELLDIGWSKEAARSVIPTGIKKSMYASVNLRGWLHFLSLRTNEEWSTYQGHPQYEIQQASKKIEALLSEQFPLVFELWNEHGRVAP